MSVFSTPPPAFSIEEAEAMVFDFYGLIVRASALNSERDQNFLCSTSDGERIYVSGRKDGNLHIFNGVTGKLERSIPLGNNPLAGGVQVFSSP